jgi:hypothetical protein
MTRLTEYHNGVAVITGKRYKEAAEKLARFEDIVDGLTDADILRFEIYLKVYCNIDVADFKDGGINEI